MKIPTGYYQLPDGTDFREGDKYYSAGQWFETINHINGKEKGWKVNTAKDGYVYIRKQSMTETIKINGKSFDLDITRATELGVLKPTFVLKAGDKYKFVSSEEVVYPIKGWDNKWYLGGLNSNPFLLYSGTVYEATEKDMTAYLQKHYVKID